MTHISIRGIRLAALAVLALELLAPMKASAATWHVTPTGDGIYSGTDWDNAFSNVQDAVNAVAGAGDVIRLKAGTYAMTNALAITAKPSFTLAGGYAGGEDPDALSGDPSILKPAAAGTRVITAADTTFALERLTVAQGNFSGNGGGIYLTNCVTTLRSLVVRENTANGIVVYGGAIYAKGGALTLRDSTVSSNRLVRTAVSDLSAMGLYGAGIYCQGVVLSVSNSQIRANGFHDGDSRMVNYNSRGYGGGLHLDGGSLVMIDSEVLDNYVHNHRARNGLSYGGGLYANNTAPLRLVASRFAGNGCQADSTWPDGGYTQPPAQEGGSLYFTGSGLIAVLEHCVMMRNAGVAGVGGNGDLRIAGGSVTMTNCLVALNAQGGVIVSGGTVAIANSSIADNTGWGLRRTGGTVTVRDSIVWGNLLGGISGTVADTSTCGQEARGGDGNLNANPLFTGDYYLSSAGLTGQTLNSPCLNAGSAAAVDLALDGLTTRTDGAVDGGMCDLGYHYDSGFAGELANLALFVDAVYGNNANNGLAPGVGHAFKTIGRALDAAVRDTVITIATGKYDADLGETFPLTVETAHLTLLGAGPDATVLDAAGAQTRVLDAVAPGRLSLSGLAIRNGRLNVSSSEPTGLRGAGLFALGADVNVSNCLVGGNIINATMNPGSEMYFLGGAGLYVTGGALKLTDSAFITNAITRSGGNTGYFQGGGVYAEDVAMTADNCTFRSNRLDSVYVANYHYYMHGGAIRTRNGSVAINNCAFTGNFINLPNSSQRDGFGGAICAERTRPVTIRTSAFSGNWAGPLKVVNNANYRLRGGTIFLYNSAEGVMDRCSVLNGDTALYSDDHGGVEIDYVGAGYSLPAATATLRMTNCLVAANADCGVAVRGAKGRLSLVNCTVAGNKAWGARNYTVGALQTIQNSIIWGNASGGISTNVGDTVNYTLAQEMHPGTQNKSSDPLFAVPGTGNYRLLEGSPAWNAGLDAGWMVAATDLDGNPRLAGTVDLGCYELPPPGGTVILVR